MVNGGGSQAARLEPARRVDPVVGSVLRSVIEIDGKRHTIGLPAGMLSGFAAPQNTQELRPASDGAITAPIPGTLQQWLVEDGAEVAADEVVAVMEAMKMETRILSPKAGRISLRAKPGTAVALGAELARVT